MAQFNDDPNTNSLFVKEFLNNAKNPKERNSIVSFIAGEDIVPIIRDMNKKLIKPTPWRTLNNY
tara:strand:+ start:345 stop:536 length:192 start_codon:yes stop_codon:yes gene_type:complete